MTKKRPRKAAQPVQATPAATARPEPRGTSAGVDDGYRRLIGPTLERKAKGMGTVTGADGAARSESLHTKWRGKGLIDQNLHDGAEKYRDDYETAGGARSGGSGQSVPPWERMPASVAQVNAISRLRRANEVLGDDLRLFVDAVVMGAAPSELARRYGGAKGGRGWADGVCGRRIAARMVEAMARMDTHYFGTRKDGVLVKAARRGILEGLVEGLGGERAA